MTENKQLYWFCKQTVLNKVLISTNETGQIPVKLVTTLLTT